MTRQIGLIAACDLDGMIGYDGSIPWFNKTDLKRFKSKTSNSTLIMGRKTYASLPTNKVTGKKLSDRKKIVLTLNSELKSSDPYLIYTSAENDVDSNINQVIELADKDKDIWFIGGKAIYEMAMDSGLVDIIDLTIINIHAEKPDMVFEKVVWFPEVPYTYKVVNEINNTDDKLLWHRLYERR